MAITQADVDRLDAAIVRGVLRLEIDGRVIIYRSMAEMKEARAHAASMITSGAPVSRSTLVSVSRR